MSALAPSPHRPAPLLPRGDRGDRALVFVVAVLCAIACLCAEASLAVARASRGWTGELAAAATVQVRAKPGETPAEAAGRAAEALAGVPGVAEARALDRGAAERLLEPWFGRGGVPEDLPIPQLVAVDLDPHRPAGAPALEAALARAGVEGDVDDGRRWMDDVRRTASGLMLGAVAAAAVVAAAAAAVVAYATRAGLAARREVVEVLHLVGARDGYVAAIFERRFGWLAARAGALGAAAAAAIAACARLGGGSDGFTPVLPAAWSDLLVVLPCPLIVGAVAAVAARRTALAILRPAL